MPKKRKKSFRSQQWFNNPKNPDRLELKKFNPVLKKYTIHKEIK